LAVSWKPLTKFEAERDQQRHAEQEKDQEIARWRFDEIAGQRRDRIDRPHQDDDEKARDAIALGPVRNLKMTSGGGFGHLLSPFIQAAGFNAPSIASLPPQA
jgi:hypothetical protein